MQIEACKKYVTRLGLIVGPANAQPHSAQWPWHIEGVGSFTNAGRFNGEFDDAKDLMAVAPGEDAISPGTWRLIATAPKDGTTILGYIPQTYVPKSSRRRSHTNSGMILEIWWAGCVGGSPLNTPPKHAIELVEKHGGYWTASRSGFRPTEGSPTHWMPLPPPPSTTPQTGSQE